MVGTADRKPAVASSAVESLSLDLCGLRDKMSCFEASYALGKQVIIQTEKGKIEHTQKETAKIGVTPRSGGTIPLYIL